MGYFTFILFRREQRRQSLSFIVAISRGNGAIGHEQQENDMERAYKSAIRELSTDELSTADLEEVAGGLIVITVGNAPQRAHEIVASFVASYNQWWNASSLGGRK